LAFRLAKMGQVANGSLLPGFTFNAQDYLAGSWARRRQTGVINCPFPAT